VGNLTSLVEKYPWGISKPAADRRDGSTRNREAVRQAQNRSLPQL